MNSFMWQPSGNTDWYIRQSVSQSHVMF